MMRISAFSAVPSGIDAEALLEDVGIHVFRLGVARKGEVAQRVADIFALVKLNRVHAVAVMADDQIRACVDGRASQRHLTLVGHIVLFIAPVVGDDDQRAARVAERLNIAFDGGINVFVVAVEGLIGQHADFDARIRRESGRAEMTAVRDSGGGQRVAGCPDIRLCRDP